MKKANYLYDYSLLKGKIISKYGNLGNFAEKVLNINRNSFSRILNNKTRFSQDMIIVIVSDLGIPTKEIPEYFFELKSQKVASI